MGAPIGISFQPPLRRGGQGRLDLDPEQSSEGGVGGVLGADADDVGERGLLHHAAVAVEAHERGAGHQSRVGADVGETLVSGDRDADGTVGFVSGQVGQRGVTAALKKTGRPSLVVLLLGGIIGLACLIMCVSLPVSLAMSDLTAKEHFALETEWAKCSYYESH